MPQNNTLVEISSPLCYWHGLKFRESLKPGTARLSEVGVSDKTCSNGEKGDGKL